MREMTPHLLYTIGGHGLAAVAAILVCCWVLGRLPRAWRAATNARPAPAAVLTTVAALTSLGLSTWVSWPHSPDWLNAPIKDIGEAYYASIIGVLSLVTAVASVLACLSACVGVVAVITWLHGNDQPEDHSEVSRWDRLRRWWRLYRAEKRLARIAADQNPDSEVIVGRIFADGADLPASMFRIAPPASDVDKLMERFRQDRAIDTVGVNNPDGHEQVIVHWDSAAFDDNTQVSQGFIFAFVRSSLRRRKRQRIAAATAVALICGAALIASHITGKRPDTTASPAPAAAASAPIPTADDWVLEPVATIGEACAAMRQAPSEPHPCLHAGADGTSYTFEFDEPRIITAIQFAPYRLSEHEVPLRVIWRFNKDSDTDIVQDVQDDWTTKIAPFGLQVPGIQATTVTMIVADAIPGSNGGATGPIGPNYAIQIIGHAPSSPPTSDSPRERTSNAHQ